MKKIFLLLVLGIAMKGFGQTYTMEILMKDAERECNHVIWSFSDLVDEEVINKHSIGTKTFTNVPNSKTFKLSAIPQCEVEYPVPACVYYSRYNDEATTIQLIEGYILEIIGCYVNIRMSSFKPNVTITNQKSAIICSGEELNLQGFPADFPNEAYHWQYSFDGVTNWVDVSNKIGTRELNNTPLTRFSIYEILGNDHVNHFDKPIYFRLGYGEDRGFTAPLAITYSSCAPIIRNVVYEPPTCNGDAIKKVEVTFSRPLNPGESLDRIKMKDVVSGLERNERTDINVFSLNDPYKYLFTNIDALENGHTYKIVYQAQIADPSDSTKKMMKGFLESPRTLDFTYNDPAKLKFEIKEEDITQPTCSGGIDGSIKINVISGVAPYRFYQDNILITPEKIDNQHYIIKGLKANPNGYKIKVTDTNDCIEKK